MPGCWCKCIRNDGKVQNKSRPGDGDNRSRNFFVDNRADNGVSRDDIRGGSRETFVGGIDDGHRGDNPSEARGIIHVTKLR